MLVHEAAPALPENLAIIDDFDVLFAEFVEYARNALNHSEATLRWYRRAYSSYRRYLTLNADAPAAVFRARMYDLPLWIAAMRTRMHRGKRISAIAVNSMWRGLRRFFVDLEARHGRVNPFRGEKQPKFDPAPPKARDVDDCRSILDTAYHYPWPEPHVAYKRHLAKAALAVMLYSGLRRGEVVMLQNGDVDLKNGTIQIERGKGPAGGHKRVAYVSHELRTILHAYLRERNLLGESFRSGAFFVSPKTRRGLSFEGLRKITEKVRRASGVPFTAHVLRHSFITHLLRADVPIHIVKELAGHRNITTTLGYLRVFNEDLARGIEKIRFR